MNHWQKVIVLSAGLALAVPISTWASGADAGSSTPGGPGAYQQAPQEMAPATQPPGAATGNDMGSASNHVTPASLLHKQVKTAKGDKVGTVEKVAIQKSDHQVVSVVKTDGVLGIGSKRIAVPVSELRMDSDGTLALADGITENQLKKNMPYRPSQYRIISS